MGELQIGRVIEGQPEAVGKMQGRRPAVSVGMRVGRDVEQRKIGKRGIAEGHIDTAPANGDRQAVGDFETPKGACAPFSATLSNIWRTASVVSSA